MWRRTVVAMAVVAVMARAAMAADEEPHYWSDAGWGLLAVVCNVFYMPVKIVYSTVGTVTGGLAYVVTVGDDEVAQRVWSPSVGGSYVVTPAMLRGDEPILFNGVSYSSEEHGSAAGVSSEPLPARSGGPHE